jgi:hypothetical protein
MRKANAGPAMMLAGGVLALGSLAIAWTSVTLSWNGQTVAEAASFGATPMSIAAGCFLVAAGALSFRTRKVRRGDYYVLGIVGALLVFAAIGVELTRSVDTVIAGTPPSQEILTRVDEWTSHGASMDVARSFGLYLALAGGVLGLAGAILDRQERKLARSSPPPPPLPPP